jgi:hypothetical protein
MKIELTAKRVKLARVAIALVAISLAGYVAYAASTLNISNSGTVTLPTNKNLLGATFSPPAAQPNCGTTTATYSDTPAAMTWGSIAQGSSANGYICVKNQGGTGTAYMVQTSVAPATGISVTYNGTSTLASLPLANGQTSLINVVVTVALTASPGSFSYTTAIN